MSEPLNIQSHKGPYSVTFGERFTKDISTIIDAEAHFLVDANVARLYGARLMDVLSRPSTVIIDAIEDNKSLERTIPVFEHLIGSKVRRGHVLVAIGGGIIQDVTCFIASTFLRGLPWHFVPTTLLAQADSSIGSKSSINIGATKNIVGTFYPPRHVHIWTEFLDTLEGKDVQSGIGEIIKVHAIDGEASFDRMAAEFDRFHSDRTVLRRYIRDALLIKKRYIEEDEFDTGVRNIFNYGHSFGHAIESATNYQVPHGIAVTIGMDMANAIAVDRGFLPRRHFDRMHGILQRNYRGYEAVDISVDVLLGALMKDKKNTSTMLGLIFPVGERAVIKRMDVPPDETFRAQCKQFLSKIKV